MLATPWIVTLGLGILSGPGLGIDPLRAAAPSLAEIEAESSGYALAAEGSTREQTGYEAGRAAIDAGRFSEAAETFRKLAAEGGPEADRALFWQAYSEAKATRTAAALTTLKRLKTEHPESPWLDDARALEVEVRGAGAGSTVAGDDEELKLYVLDGLLSSDSERAVPLLLKFLAGNHSDALKAKALFVLSQSDSPEAFAALLEIARGAEQPRLQLEAVRVLGISGEDAAVEALEELYRTSSSREIKAEILRAMGVAGAEGALARVAREERDPELKAEAIQGLGITDSEEAGAALVEIYRQASDRKVKAAALEALFIQDNAKALLTIFKSETDRELKREALRYLSMIDDEATSELLDSILND